MQGCWRASQALAARSTATSPKTVPKATATSMGTITNPARLARTVRPTPPSGSAWRASALCRVRLGFPFCIAVISTGRCHCSNKVLVLVLCSAIFPLHMGLTTALPPGPRVGVELLMCGLTAGMAVLFGLHGVGFLRSRQAPPVLQRWQHREAMRLKGLGGVRALQCCLPVRLVSNRVSPECPQKLGVQGAAGWGRALSGTFAWLTVVPAEAVMTCWCRGYKATARPVRSSCLLVSLTGPPAAHTWGAHSKPPVLACMPAAGRPPAAAPRPLNPPGTCLKVELQAAEWTALARRT